MIATIAAAMPAIEPRTSTIVPDLICEKPLPSEPSNEVSLL
jgi:hypothetical protein